MNRKYKTRGTQEPTPRNFALEHAEVEEIQIPVKSLRVGGEKDGND